jgi:predicted TIM-barrel fold metal-dependent hydrolase
MTIIDGHVFLGNTIYMEQSGETLIASMDRVGVDISVVVAPPPGPFYREANAYVLEAVKKHPGRLAALFRANPHLEGEDERFRDALGRGFSGLQLDPTNDGYGVGGKIMEPVIKVAEEEEAPVYIHSGDSIFCPPEAVAEYASRFPGVNFVTSQSRRAYRAVKDRSNVYLTTRPFPTLAFKRGYADDMDLDRLIFASDAPLGNLDIELKGVELSRLKDETRERILGGNLRRILQILQR